ncbi:MAG TPA: type II toxin-antitoxin system VapC family toxin [Candidatus Hydrogenedentes bacterium]|nr:type II toxin-antitoxin system VapC family toxin [Candidatus Hydrogenedentota bacterium]
MKTYFDSSALAKRYVEEAGSDVVEAICQEATELGISVIGAPEIISALNRRRRENVLTPHQYKTAKRRLSEELKDATIIHLTSPVITDTIRILEESPVRAMDALHIACALQWGAMLFVSADERQITAAKKAGLLTRVLG